MAGNEESFDLRLSEIYQRGFDLFYKIESGEHPSNSSEFRRDVAECRRLFEESTRLVSSTGMFSANENVDETPTEYLRYLLLPFFLGQLNSKCSTGNREEALKAAVTYYNDFLKRCVEYGICNEEKKTPDNCTGIIQIAQKRQAKIESYHQRKELEAQINQMKDAINNEHVDDEIKREFYLKLINLSILDAREELKSNEQELGILKFRHEMNSSNAHKTNKPDKPPRINPENPLQTIILTKDAVQKAVFGMGYPSVPVMTVDEFYEQRVREGIFPDEEKVAEMNKTMFRQNSEEKEEEEKAQKEQLVENDDPEYLERQRAFDEYKDQVRRGDGNRYNRS